MQKVSLKAVFLALLVLAVAAVAGPSEAKLVGIWSQEGDKAATWTFRPDGSGFWEQENPKATARFTWSCQGVALQVSTGNLVVPYTVVSVNGNNLLLRNERSSQTYKLQRKG